VFTDHGGTVVREISITPIPVDQPPFPLPTGVQVPIYFTIQPGGAYVAVHAYGNARKGAWLVYPNYHRLPAGAEAHFWHYDPEEKGWYVYGLGTVNESGAQVVPNPGVSLYEFTGEMQDSGQSKGTTRTYRTGDNGSRPFGIGTTHPYAMFLWTANPYQDVDLVLPDGREIHYVRTSSGTGFTDAAYEHTSSPTVFYKSTLAWNGAGWDLTLKDGMVYVFGENAPLQSIRDRFGNAVTLTWSSTNGSGSGYGRILKITSPNGRWIAFTYDGSNRITEAKDNLGRTVGYQYDGSGRVWKVTDARGGVTEYTYDIAHRMLTITDPRSITYLETEYDVNGRVELQTQADGGEYAFAFTVNGSGQVTQTDLTNPRGYVQRLTFNGDGFLTSDTHALGEAEEQTTT
jgi:YD repeat-containing protein